MIAQEQFVKVKKVGEHDVFSVHHVRYLTPSTYIVRFDRNNMFFLPGQHLSVGLINDTQAREYSIYSSVNDPFLEILVKEVEDGLVSKKLKKLKPGAQLRVTGPMGFFKLDENKTNTHPHLFIGTGTGISPFHCFVESYPKLNFKLLHGVRFGNEAYDRDHYPKGNYILCTSGDKAGDFNGRVTGFLKKLYIDPETNVYLCGNCDMIFEVYDILTEKGVPVENIHTEVYF